MIDSEAGRVNERVTIRPDGKMEGLDFSHGSIVSVDTARFYPLTRPKSHQTIASFFLNDFVKNRS